MGDFLADSTHMVDERIRENVVVSSQLGERQPLLPGRCHGSLGRRHVKMGVIGEYVTRYKSTRAGDS